MTKALNKLISSKYKNSYVFIFFITLLITGINIFADYGISIDEDNTRVIGFLSLEKIYSFFSLNNISEITKIIESDALAHSRDDTATSGVAFDLPMAFIEYFFGIKDSRSYFLLRHFSTFLIFIISSIYFYRIIFNKYRSVSFSLLGTSFLIISPRIFGESFFNNKDIVLMSFFIIGFFYAVKFIQNKNIFNSIYFAFICSLIINVRILGLILPLIISFFYLISILRSQNNKIYSSICFVTFVFLFLIFSFLLSPYLWVDTLDNLFKTLSYMKNHFLNLNIFYLGKYYFFSEVPWHYHMTSILVSTPIIYTFLFIIGFIVILKRTTLRLFNIDKNISYKDLWRGDKELQDLLCFIILVSMLLITIDTGKLSYNGWRHLYFIYPFFILISLKGLSYLENNFVHLKRNKKVLKIFILILMLPTLLWMYKNHPYQNLYFNSLVKNNFNRYFEVDYWGLTNKEALEIIIKKEEKIVNIYNNSTSDLNLTKKILRKDDRKMINIVGNSEDADYIINHFYDWRSKKDWQDYKPPHGFEILDEIKVNNVSINSIYKRRILN